MATHDITPDRMRNRLKPLPPVETLLAEAKRIYRYDEATGNLVWIRPANPGHPGQAKIGGRVGGSDGHGYLMCMLLGHKFKVHQIVWLLNKGELARFPIDHKNRDRLDTRIENLRLAVDIQNSQNTNKMLGALTGSRSHRGRTGYSAIIQINGKKIYLGYYKSREEAHEAYVLGSRKYRGEFSPV